MLAKRYVKTLFAVLVLVCLAVAQEPRQVSNEEANEHLTKRVPARYPSMAEMAHIQGDVIVRVTIDENGKVTEAKGASGHPLLLEAAIPAVKQWEFQPFSDEGKPVPVQALVKVNFSLGPGAELRSKYLQQEVDCTRQIQNK